LYGATGSSDFPTTASAYDPVFNGGDTMTFMFNGTYFYHGTDIYVAKLSPAGNQLLASTFIGGGKNDGVNTNIITTYTVDYLGSGVIYTLTESKADSLQFNYGDQYRGEIQLDNGGYPVICSSSRSPNFPTKNPVDATLGGMQDAVVFKFDPNLSMLQWSTFFGGSNNDAGYALFIAQNNETYFTGGTRSNDLTTSPTAYKTNFGGGKADGYIGKISASGSNLMACTYIGTNDYDQSYFIQLDKNQNAYVLGQSLGNMPVTNVIYSNPNSKQFVTKLDSSLSSVVYSTIIGNGNGIINLSPAAFLIDCSENIYISGWGGNIIYGPATINMPLTANAYQSSSLDGYNFYLMVLSKNAQALLYATYFGGAQSHEHVDGGTSRFDKKGIIYQSVCAGCGGHDDFPIYPMNAWPGTPGNPNHNTDNNNCNNGVFKFNFEYNSPHAVLSTNVVKGCSPLTVNFTNSSVSYTHYTWNFGGGDTTSTVLNPVKTFTVPGTYTVTLLVSNSACFAGFDTTRITITVYPPVTANFHYTVTPCGNTFQFTDSSYNSITKWLWNLGDGSVDTTKNPAHSYMQSGTYTVTDVVQNQYGCKDSMKKVLVITGVNLSISANTVKCLNQSIQLNASGGISYTWSPAASLNNANIPNPIATPTVNTQYTLALTQVDASGDTCISILHTNVAIAAVPTPSLSTYATPDTIYVGGSSQLGTYVSGGGTIQWSPTYSLSDPTSFNPTASPHHTQTYTAVYTNAAGCTFPLSSVTIYVLTKDCDPNTIFVPNTFTPNNDGMNDVLYARSPLISDIHFVIADRWGQIVFTTDDLTKGWDGNFNGKQCNPDVFGYFITYKCNNGKSSFKKGNITLIR
jgi:gliding motility-associated-like protein